MARLPFPAVYGGKGSRVRGVGIGKRMGFKRLVKKSNIWDFPAFSTHPPTPLSLRKRGNDKARNELPPLLKSGAPAPAWQEWGAIEGAREPALNLFQG